MNVSSFLGAYVRLYLGLETNMENIQGGSIPYIPSLFKNRQA